MGIQEALKYIDDNSKIVTGDVNAYSLLSYAKNCLRVRRKMRRNYRSNE